ncbi:MAG: hypothetical protein ACOVQX_01875 [Legionella sp.]
MFFSHTTRPSYRITTVDELIHVVNLLTPQGCYRLLPLVQDQLPDIIYAGKKLNAINSATKCQMLCKAVANQLSNIIHDIDDLYAVLHIADDELKANIIHNVFDKLITIIQKANDLNKIIDFLPVNTYEAIGKQIIEQRPDMIQKLDDLTLVLRIVPQALRTQTIDIIFIKLPTFIKTGENLNQVIQYLPFDYKRKVYEALNEFPLPNMVDLHDLTYLLQLAAPEKTTDIIHQIVRHLTTSEELNQVLSYLSEEKSMLVCSTITELKRINHAVVLSQWLHALTDHQQRLLLTAFNTSLAMMIDSTSDVNLVICGLSTENCNYILTNIAPKLAVLIRHIGDIHSLFQLLPYKLQVQVYSIVDKQVIAMIRTAIDFERFIMTIDINLRAMFCASIQEHLTTLIKTINDLKKITPFLQNNQKSFIYNNITLIEIETCFPLAPKQLKSQFIACLDNGRNNAATPYNLAEIFNKLYSYCNDKNECSLALSKLPPAWLIKIYKAKLPDIKPENPSYSMIKLNIFSLNRCPKINSHQADKRNDDSIFSTKKTIFLSEKLPIAPQSLIHIKQRILDELKIKIESTNSLGQLSQLTTAFMQSDKYRQLGIHQQDGLAKRLNLDTSSIKTFKQLIDNQKKMIHHRYLIARSLCNTVRTGEKNRAYQTVKKSGSNPVSNSKG